MESRPENFFFLFFVLFLGLKRDRRETEWTSTLKSAFPT